MHTLTDTFSYNRNKGAIEGATYSCFVTFVDNELKGYSSKD